MADAKQCIKLDKAFVKGHLHLGKVLLAMGEHAEAVQAVQSGLTSLQEAGQPQAHAPCRSS